MFPQRNHLKGREKNYITAVASDNIGVRVFSVLSSEAPLVNLTFVKPGSKRTQTRFCSYLCHVVPALSEPICV